MMFGVLNMSVVACGGYQGGSTPSSIAAESNPDSHSLTSTTDPTGLDTPVSPQLVEIPHGAPDLEALLPNTFHEQSLFKVSWGPANLAASPAGPAIMSITDAAGGDGTLTAFAAANNPPSATFNLVVIAGPGSHGDALVDAYISASIASGESLSASEATLGGRTVTRVRSPSTNPLGDIWVYAVDDMLYGVQSKDEELAAELIGLMP